jgi:hypothetical protein
MSRSLLHDLVERLRGFQANQVKIAERLELLNRPWEENLLHWVWNGDAWSLHGYLCPPPDGRRRSVTRGGWCPGSRCGRRPRPTQT